MAWLFSWEKGSKGAVCDMESSVGARRRAKDEGVNLSLRISL